MAQGIDHESEILDRLRRAVASRYSVERPLGRGGMGLVYLARDRKHAQRAVAFKVLRPEVAATLGAERFLREIRIAALLNHPHIVPLFDSGEAEGLLYYVMPMVEGETLRQRLRRDPPPGLAEALRIGAGVAAALACAHQHGIVHRDIKPENIILSGGEAIVTDFGIARAVRAAGESITGAGLTLGTPGYMSPEQATGALEVDARADVYSLGAVLYEMLAGEPPSPLGEETARIGRFRDVPARTRTRLDALPRGLEAALARALAAVPEVRFASAEAFAEALQRAPAEARAETRSVAILPFVTLRGGAEEGFLGDGLAEEITNALARVRALRVASRTSAFAYKDRRADIRVIGRELGVDAVLEGSVQRAGDALRVTVQLVNAADGYHLWSERYDRSMQDVFAIQDEIARSVARALEVLLTESDQRALARVPTLDVAAYEYYLRGRQLFHERRKASLELARAMFTRAIEIDPGFALAHAGIADSCSLLHVYYPSAASVLDDADRASQRALELAPDLPEAHAARGFAFSQLGRAEEAAAEFQTAIRLDPAQFDARYFYGRQCFQRGEPAEAARWFEDAARVQEDFEARFFAAQAYEALGDREAAQAAYRRALLASERHLELHPDHPRAATMRAVSLCRLGEPAEGLVWARRALELDPSDAGVRYNVACLYALEGQEEEAIRCLEECVRLGFGNLEWIARDPDLASLRDDPRFQALLAGGSGGARAGGPAG